MHNSSLTSTLPNNSYYSTGNQSADYIPTPDVSIFLGVLVALLSVTSTLANVLLITIIVRTPSLHTKTNAAIVSISVSELLVGAFVMPVKSSSLFYPQRQMPSSLCDFVKFMSYLTVSSKSLGMLSLSIDRCVAVSHPLQYASCITKSTSIAFLSCVWVMGISFAVLPLAGIGTYLQFPDQENCPVISNKSIVFPIIFELTFVVVPSTIIAINVLIVLVEARSHHRVITIAQLAIAMYSGPAAASGINYSRSTFKAMRTYLIICNVYLFACFPRSIYTVAVLVNIGSYHSTAYNLFTLLFYACCITTPLVISTMNSKFKQSIKALFKRKNRVKPQADIEPYTITTGLHSILETSMVLKFVSHNDTVKSSVRDNVRPGPSVDPVVTFAKRKISILNEIHSSSSSDVPSGSKSVHIQLRKSLSSPM